VTPPDRYGYCSLGISVDISLAAIEAADHVIAQVNPAMPRTHGDTFVPVSWLDSMVLHEEPLLELPKSGASPECGAIGGHIARLIEDGSTLQVGIGAIPDAVLSELGSHRDLGVHTEMLSDGVMELIRSGVVTNEKKSIHKGKVIASFCMGSRKLYEFIDDNPMFELHPSDYTNDPVIIAKNSRMVAINSAIQVDLTGQVCSDSIGYRLYSGIGGQVDFTRGAAMAKGGKPVIALPSTADGGAVSRIVSHLDEGAGVVTTRGDVHYVVTEHGVAYLHGRSIRDRALSLIEIAHPKYRESLLAEAKEKGFVYPDQELASEAIYPVEHERWQEFEGGLRVFFRPVRAADEQGIQRLFHSLSSRSRYLRFFTAMTALPHRRAQKMTLCDPACDMGIVGILPIEDDHEAHEEVIAAAQYVVERRSGMAEAALMVADEYHGRGIGTFLVKHLIQVARASGIKGFRADVLAENKAMLRVFLKSGYDTHLEARREAYHLELTFDAPPKAAR
jgi:GNAT superfamily N-acetyltransferase